MNDMHKFKIEDVAHKLESELCEHLDTYFAVNVTAKCNGITVSVSDAIINFECEVIQAKDSYKICIFDDNGRLDYELSDIGDIEEVANQIVYEVRRLGRESLS